MPRCRWTMKRVNTADPTIESPQLSQASTMDTSAMSAMAPLGLFGRRASPFRIRVKRGVVARMYPVTMIRHICMAKVRRIQKPFPQY